MVKVSRRFGCGLCEKRMSVVEIRGGEFYGNASVLFLLLTLCRILGIFSELVFCMKKSRV